jgi:hypothetical protein
MTAPVRQKIEVIGEDAAVAQLGSHPTIVRTCPFAPVVSPILLPIRVSPVPNMSAFSLELNVVQSVRESAPVVAEDARARESC